MNRYLIFACLLVVTVGSAAADWKVALGLANNGGSSATLSFGAAAGATDGVDAPLGEVELPPLPPATAFDARWVQDKGNGLWKDFRAAATELKWVLQVQAGSGGSPIRLAWPAEGLPAGELRLQDAVTGGKAVDVDMKAKSSARLDRAAIDRLQIVWRQSAQEN